MPEKMSVTAEADATRNAAIRAEVAAATGRAWESGGRRAADDVSTDVRIRDRVDGGGLLSIARRPAFNICGIPATGELPPMPWRPGPAATDGPNGSWRRCRGWPTGRIRPPGSVRIGGNCPLTMRHCQRSLRGGRGIGGEAALAEDPVRALPACR